MKIVYDCRSLFSVNRAISGRKWEAGKFSTFYYYIRSRSKKIDGQRPFLSVSTSLDADLPAYTAASQWLSSRRRTPLADESDERRLHSHATIVDASY